MECSWYSSRAPSGRPPPRRSRDRCRRRAACPPGSRAARRRSRCRCRRRCRRTGVVRDVRHAAHRIAAVDRARDPVIGIERRPRLAVEHRVAGLGARADVRVVAEAVVRDVRDAASPRSQVSSVQPTPSSGSSGVPAWQSSTASQVSTPSQTSVVAQASFGTLAHVRHLVAGVVRAATPSSGSSGVPAWQSSSASQVSAPVADVRVVAEAVVRRVDHDVVASSHESSVQATPSSQSSGVPAWQSSSASQVSTPSQNSRVVAADRRSARWRTRPSPRRTSRPCRPRRRRSPAASPPGSRARASQVSARRRQSVLSQRPSFGALAHCPSTSSHESSVQATPSSQSSGVPAWQSSTRVAGLDAVADSAVVAETVVRRVGARRSPRRTSRPCRPRRRRGSSGVPAWQSSSASQVSTPSQTARCRRGRRSAALSPRPLASSHESSVQATPSSIHRRRPRLAVEHRVAGLRAVADVRCRTGRRSGRCATSVDSSQRVDRAGDPVVASQRRARLAVEHRVAGLGAVADSAVVAEASFGALATVRCPVAGVVRAGDAVVDHQRRPGLAVEHARRRSPRRRRTARCRRGRRSATLTTAVRRLVARVVRAADAVVAVRRRPGLAVEQRVAGLGAVAEQPVVAQAVVRRRWRSVRSPRRTSRPCRRRRRRSRSGVPAWQSSSASQVSDPVAEQRRCRRGRRSARWRTLSVTSSHESSVQATPSSIAAASPPGSRAARRRSRRRRRTSALSQRPSFGDVVASVRRLVARVVRAGHAVVAVRRRPRLAVEHRVAGLGAVAEQRRCRTGRRSARSRRRVTGVARVDRAADAVVRIERRPGLAVEHRVAGLRAVADSPFVAQASFGAFDDVRRLVARVVRAGHAVVEHQRRPGLAVEQRVAGLDARRRTVRSSHRPSFGTLRRCPSPRRTSRPCRPPRRRSPAASPPGSRAARRRSPPRRRRARCRSRPSFGTLSQLSVPSSHESSVQPTPSSQSTAASRIRMRRPHRSRRRCRRARRRSRRRRSTLGWP